MKPADHGESLTQDAAASVDSSRPARRPIFAALSLIISVFGLLTLAWPGGESAGQALDAALRDFNLVAILLALLVWGALVLLLLFLSFVLLCIALLRREKPVVWLVLAAVLQGVIAVLLWGDALWGAA
ncbi:MAG: hypothetical protein JNM76_12665 [Betaproteobacteria bacterium]|nr:hypothetical protein [Betaproteobacteria bacterium]